MATIGIIGAGFMARTHAQAYAACAAVDALHLLVIPEDLARAEQLRHSVPRVAGVHTTWAAFCAAGIEAVDICTPTPTHAELIGQALAARLPILCEKPLTLEAATAAALVADAERAAVPFMVAQVIRFWPEYVLLRARLAGGELGAWRTLRLERYSPLPQWGAWFGQAGASGGALFDLLIHDVDFVRDALGAPRRLLAVGRQRASGEYDDLEVLFEYAGGRRASLLASYEYPAGTPFRMQYRALFDQAALDYDLWRTPTLKLQDGAGEHAVALPPGDGYAAECGYFAECVAEGRLPERATAASGVETLRLLEAVRHSAAAGGVWIELS